MSKKKIAGVDRPYTPIDLGEIIYGYIKDGDWGNKSDLDYYIPEKYDSTEIVSEAFDLFSITTFGSNEGIYTDFYIKYVGKKEIHLLTAKTLVKSEDAYVKMHEMAAHVCYKFGKFIDNNLDRFIWRGYSVFYVDKDGKEHNYVICGNMERVDCNANELYKDYGAVKVFYVDNYTRKKYEYKI